MILSPKKLLMNLSMEKISTNSSGLERFFQFCLRTLDQLVPQKNKYVQGGNMSFFNKPLVSAHNK